MPFLKTTGLGDHTFQAVGLVIQCSGCRQQLVAKHWKHYACMGHVSSAGSEWVQVAMTLLQHCSKQLLALDDMEEIVQFLKAEVSTLLTDAMQPVSLCEDYSTLCNPTFSNRS